MVKQVVVGVVVALAVLGTAAAETVDVTTVVTPSSWSRTARDGGVVEFSTANEASGAAVLVSIAPAMATNLDARGNFDATWTQIVKAMADVKPTMAPVENRGGWQIVSGSAKLTYQGQAMKARIVTATKDGKLAIVTVISVGTLYEKDVDKLLAGIKYGGTATPAPAQATESLSGAWGFSSGGAMGTGPYAKWLSDRREYTFDGKGAYTFLRRHNVDQETDTSLIREHGTYTLAGDVLTLTPTKSEREIWTKSISGPNAGKYGKLVRRENVPKEKAAYRVSYTVYPNTNVSNLMLTPSQATQRDGNFNATTQYRLFRPDNSYYTPIPPTP